MPLLHEGQIVRDTYEVERLLGEAAFAEVYRVRHRFLGRQALKVFKIRHELSRFGGDARRSMPSSCAWAIRISTRVFEANTTETTRQDLPFTMEYVIGGSL